MSSSTRLLLVAPTTIAVLQWSTRFTRCVIQPLASASAVARFSSLDAAASNAKLATLQPGRNSSAKVDGSARLPRIGTKLPTQSNGGIAAWRVSARISISARRARPLVNSKPRKPLAPVIEITPGLAVGSEVRIHTPSPQI